MALFGDNLVIQLDLPYSQYWLPLAIGLGVGLVAVLAAKLALTRRGPGAQALNVNVKAKVDYDPFVQGSPSELRKTFRREGNPTEVLVALEGQKSHPLKGWVLDRSTGGLRMLLDQALQEGVVVSLFPANAPGMTPWTDVEVRSCRECPDGFEFGCRFVKTPTWNVLLMFG